MNVKCFENTDPVTSFARVILRVLLRLLSLLIHFTHDVRRRDVWTLSIGTRISLSLPVRIVCNIIMHLALCRPVEQDSICNNLHTYVMGNILWHYYRRALYYREKYGDKIKKVPLNTYWHKALSTYIKWITSSIFCGRCGPLSINVFFIYLFDQSVANITSPF